MSRNSLKKNSVHVFFWGAMFLYFMFSPELMVRFFNQHGKPVQLEADIPPESDRIQFVVEGLLPYLKDGEDLYQLYGWAFLIPENEASGAELVRELMLVRDTGSYVFAVRPEYRRPDLPVKFKDLSIDFKTLGFSVLIAEDILKPGRYRIGITFRDASDGSVFYRDKPVYYLVKTPNTLRLERK